MAAPCLPAGLDLEELLALLRRLCWESEASLRATYSRGVQPPFGYGEALSVDEGGEGPVTAADLAVNQHLLSEETAKEQLSAGVPLEAD